MLSDAHLLTPPTTVAHYKPEDLPSTTKSLFSSSVFLLQIDSSLTRSGKPELPMADHRPRSRSSSRQRPGDDTELWFSMASGARSDHREHEPQLQPHLQDLHHYQHLLPQEQSAYRATQTRHTANPTTSSRDMSVPVSGPVPSIFSTADLNKPLPSPGGNKKRKPASLRNLLRRNPEERSDNSRLKPDSYQYSHHQHSRSMPSSPLGSVFNQSSQPTVESRASSAAGNYLDTTEYRAYSMHNGRSVSVNTYFDATPPRARTFPDSAISPTPREAVSNRPRPHTWLSPTEPFEDASQFHLFVEATSGLVDDVDPSSTTSPRLQGSLFARTRENDVIPLPLRNPEAVDSFQSHDVTGWQNLDYEYYGRPESSHSPTSPLQHTSPSFPRPDPTQQSNLAPHLNAVNLELERLGITEDHGLEDELPDYAQSQAEMHEKKRVEATQRARELEARWKNARGRSRY